MQKVKDRAEIVYAKIHQIPTLGMSMPEGALYCFATVDLSSYRDIENSIVFAEKLAREQGVLVIPAESFMSQNGFRIVLCNPKSVLEECMDRIKIFVLEHLNNN